MLRDLIAASTTSALLDKYVSSHFNELYDFFNWTTDSELRAQLEDIQNFIAQKRLILEGLPGTKKNLSFLTFLLDISERLGLLSGFNYLYEHLNAQKFDIGSRLKGAVLYLVNVRDSSTLLQRYDEIYSLLQTSYEFEEDNVDKILTTVVNLYAKTILDYDEFNIEVVEALRKKIIGSIAADEYSFLNHQMIQEVLATSLVSFEPAYTHIHATLDQFLRRGKTKGREITGFLIESNTDYARSISAIKNDFGLIRRISVDKHITNRNNQSVYLSLHRGTAIIANESQLFGYLHSYGNMHFEKLKAAFETLPMTMFSKTVNIIDWGCGQGMATMALLQYGIDNGLNLTVGKIILIEPSELAIRRGALHAAKFLNDANIATVNKGLDDVETKDLELPGGINLHLFSNIVDVDTFSLTHLIQLIKTSFGGKNHFVVVSPYVNDVKTARIDSFVEAFSSKREFALLPPINNKAGEWLNQWTRVSRVFSVDLNFTV